MDRENRRNSILKPSLGQPLFDGDEENNYAEPTYTFSRRKSLKRVSFAGQNQVKEFEKHEALIANLKKLDHVSSDNLDVSHLDNESEKENVKVQICTVETVVTSTEVDSPLVSVDDEDMELTSTISATKDIQVLMHQTIVNEMEMEVTNVWPQSKALNQTGIMAQTTTTSASKEIQTLMHQTIVNEVEMEMTTVWPQSKSIAHQTIVNEEEMEVTVVWPQTDKDKEEISPSVPASLSDQIPLVEGLKLPESSVVDQEMSLVQDETAHGLIFVPDAPNSTQNVEAPPQIKPLSEKDELPETSHLPAETIPSEVLPAIIPEEPSQISKQVVIDPQTVIDTNKIPPATATKLTSMEVKTSGCREKKQQAVTKKRSAKINVEEQPLKNEPSFEIPPLLMPAAPTTVQQQPIREAEKVPTTVTEKLKSDIKDFTDEWAPEFGWSASKNDNELFLTKLCGCLTLKFELNFEYLQQNIRHYMVEDIEVETKRGLKNKWARFGLNVLENTLESAGLKSKCNSTQDLDKLLRYLEEPISLFEEFILHDSEPFEWMTNPRTLQVDIDNLALVFELSNLENLLLIRISLKLNTAFPLSAADVAIENVIGNINTIELINMISAMSPNGRYLTRVAECIEDFLKFPPTKNECGVLDITRS